MHQFEDGLAAAAVPRVKRRISTRQHCIIRMYKPFHCVNSLIGACIHYLFWESLRRLKRIGEASGQGARLDLPSRVESAPG